jgi:hypothetical protein
LSFERGVAGLACGGESAFEHPPCFRCAVESDEDSAEVEVAGGVVGSEGDETFEGGEGFGVATGLDEDDAEVAVQFRKLGIERESGVEGSEGFVHASGAGGVGSAAEVPRGDDGADAGIVRGEADEGVDVGSGGVEAAGRGLAIDEEHEGVDAVGAQFEGAGDEGEAGGLVCGEEGFAEVEHGLGLSGVETEGFAVGVDGFVGATESIEDDAVLVVEFGRVGCASERVGDEAEGVVATAEAQQEIGEADGESRFGGGGSDAGLEGAAGVVEALESGVDVGEGVVDGDVGGCEAEGAFEQGKRGGGIAGLHADRAEDFEPVGVEAPRVEFFEPAIGSFAETTGVLSAAAERVGACGVAGFFDERGEEVPRSGEVGIVGRDTFETCEGFGGIAAREGDASESEGGVGIGRDRAETSEVMRGGFVGAVDFEEQFGAFQVRGGVVGREAEGGLQVSERGGDVTLLLSEIGGVVGPARVVGRGGDEVVDEGGGFGVEAVGVVEAGEITEGRERGLRLHETRVGGRNAAGKFFG